MLDLPEIPNLFSPCLPAKVAHDRGIAVRIGNSPAQDILHLRSGQVIARDASRHHMVNTSIAQYRRSLVVVAEGRHSADELERELRRIDVFAYDANASYWRTLVDQMRA